MKAIRLSQLCAALLLFAYWVGHASFAATARDHWIGTWAASPQAESNEGAMVGSNGTTYREVVHISRGGAAVRIVVTNEFGLDPLTIGVAQIAMSAGGNAIELRTANALRFSGRASVTIPAGALMVSDPVPMKLPPLANVAVSLFLPAQPIRRASIHSYALQTNYLVVGDVVGEQTLTTPTETPSWYFLKGVEVEADATNTVSGAIVALGDSITDGAASEANTNGRWPDVLARSIQANKTLAGIGVLNAGINGNRLLRDGDGDQSALRRLDRDVLAQPGIQYLLVLEGINDIGHIVSATPGDPAVTAQDLIGALQQIAVRGHAHGILVIGATILPYENCKYASPDGEKMREEVNEWIRNNHSFDGVVDFDKVVRDPRHPTRFLNVYDSGDHLHPNAAGLRAMGESIDLSLLAR
jgi:lysophospholipase L1-like esterase